MTAVRVAAATLVMALLVGCGSSGGAPRVEASAEDADLSFVVLAGTGARIDAGDPVDVFPRRLDARVGDVIRIENHDERGHIVGPFFVGAGETVTQRFSSPGTYRGRCSVHPSGEVTLTIRE